MLINTPMPEHPNPVRGDMRTSPINISPLQGFWVEHVSVLYIFYP